MSADVTIPADLAKRYADAIRNPNMFSWPDGLDALTLADLLDPPPPATLREQIARDIEAELLGIGIEPTYNSGRDAGLRIAARIARGTS